MSRDLTATMPHGCTGRERDTATCLLLFHMVWAEEGTQRFTYHVACLQWEPQCASGQMRKRSRMLKHYEERENWRCKKGEE